MSAVIAVSRIPGSGKSTMARILAEHLGAGLVEFDRYQTMTRRPVGEIEAWLARGGDYAELEAPGFREAVIAAAARGVVVLDTPLGRADPRTGAMITHAVWLDCPEDLALARKLSQVIAGMPPGQEKPLVGWIGGYLDGYVRVVKPAITVQLRRVAPMADFTVDAGGEMARVRLDLLEKSKVFSEPR